MREEARAAADLANRGHLPAPLLKQPLDTPSRIDGVEMAFTQNTPTDPHPKLPTIYSWWAQVKADVLLYSIQKGVKSLRDNLMLMLLRVTNASRAYCFCEPV